MKTSYSIYALILFITFSSCDQLIYKQGNGDMVMRDHDIDEFSKLSLEGNFEVFLKSGDHPVLSIEIDENLEDYIEVYTRNETLIISSTKRIRSKDGIKIFLTYKNLNRLSSSGASSIYTENPIRTKELKVSLSGAGMIDLELETRNLEIQLSGAGMITVEGETNFLDLGMSGAGSFEGGNLIVNDATVTISGVGSAFVNVSGELNARISGIGGIEYSGNPQKVNRSVSGLGKISQAD